MINDRLPTVFGVLIVLALLPAPAAYTPALAAPAHNPEVPAVAQPGNAAEAEAILNAKLLVCSTCHGTEGRPKTASTPIIWGLQENYLLKQLNDFQHGDRKNDVMNWMATALSQAEVAPAAAYFAKKNWPARSTTVASAPAPASVAVCQICHQQDFVGGLPGPRLAGQSYEYLVDTMRRFADGERKNNADMTQIMKAISPADRDALARYIAGL
jgi:cytochrome c553